MDTELDDPSDTRRRRGAGPLAWLLALGLLALVLAGGWWWWSQQPQAVDTGPDLSPEALDARLLQTEQAAAALRRNQQTIEQRLGDTQGRTGLLREEVLGLGQRAAILEDNLREVRSQAAEGTQALRLDEVELLLGLAQARLVVAGDTDGAIRSLVLAQQALAAMTDPQFISLRQTLAQEIAALRALPADPRDEAAGELDALEATLPRLASRAPGAPPSVDAGDSRWQRILDALVQVRPSSRDDLISPADRATGEATLALELALARTALERRDETAFRASLARVDQWLQRLYADDATLRDRRERLRALGERPLSPTLPEAGAALQQLRDLRRGRDATP
ncbi:uroporphyrinogen-III C-methyltransferase [Arenimonas sp.]|uniref:uroporphyrinogen-III C-methyltransferase n=1 Tax=Arenimonas sp. TaxID=1872635 RepID=UPI0035AE1117